MGESLAHVHSRVHRVRFVQVEGGSTLRDDSRACFPLAQADAASHAEGDDGCKQRNYKLLHLRPPEEKFNFMELTMGSAGAEL
jgi:hypothetical protein